MLVAPTEPAELIEALGATRSPIPEQYGVDVLVGTRVGLAGWQRKEVGDLLASIEDGRLARELGLMSGLGYRSLVVEGRPEWTSDGYLLLGYRTGWRKAALRGFLRTVQAAGVIVEWTDDLRDTATAIREAWRWLGKKGHTSLLSRPGPSFDLTVSRQEAVALHILQGFPQLGPARAKALYNAYGLPLRWTVTPDELARVPGIGKQTAKRLYEVLKGRRREGNGG